MFRRWLRTFLVDWSRALVVYVGRIPRPELVARVMEQHPSPEDLPAGVLVIVKDGAIAKWACLRCPGGCGARLQLS
ncbi:MAG: hypothetical protein JWR10_4703 [Rubritepida sp.]|nr:hypothetical protein [Rubritepida sp.]